MESQCGKAERFLINSNLNPKQFRFRLVRERWVFLSRNPCFLHMAADRASIACGSRGILWKRLVVGRASSSVVAAWRVDSGGCWLLLIMRLC